MGLAHEAAHHELRLAPPVVGVVHPGTPVVEAEGVGVRVGLELFGRVRRGYRLNMGEGVGARRLCRLLDNPQHLLVAVVALPLDCP